MEKIGLQFFLKILAIFFGEKWLKLGKFCNFVMVSDKKMYDPSF